MVEAQSRVGGRPGAADGQVDTRVLVRTDKWYASEKAWPIWSFMTRAYAGAIDRDLSLDTTNADVRTDVSNVQLGGVQFYVVLIMLRTRRALDCAVSALYSWDMRAWRMFCHAYSLWDAARLVVLMIEVLVILLDTKDAEVNLDAGCIEMTSVDLNALDVDVILKRSSKGASESSGRNRDSEFVYCYYEERQREFECHRKRRNHDMGQSKGSKKSKSKRKEQERVQVLSRVRQVWSGCEIQRSKACSKQAREAWQERDATW